MDQGLAMTRIGDGWMFGHRAAFRTYETPDHTEALVWYSTFGSEQEARNAVTQSLKAHKVTGREFIRDLNGRVIGDRIVAAPKERKKAFMIAQRQGLNCWIIQSTSESCDAGRRVDRTTPEQRQVVGVKFALKMARRRGFEC